MGFELEIPLAASEVWRRIARAQEFLCLDPFHCRVVLLSPRLTAGAELRIDHLIMGISIARFGRILYWNEEEGYALSDLSGRGKRRGFPHVFFIRVTPMGQQGCRLTVEVRGRWTTPFVPARIGMYWLRWVASDHARLLQKTI